MDVIIVLLAGAWFFGKAARYLREDEERALRKARAGAAPRAAPVAAVSGVVACERRR